MVMMNLEEINKAIQELENSDLTYDTCQKLAMLYTVRDHNMQLHFESTYNTILPSYNTYCEDKRRYQLGQLSENSVLEDLRFVCSEMLTFMQTIYSGTNMEQERTQLKEVINQLTKIYL